jgi:hypothetical protein
MPLIQLVVILVVIGVILWAINSYIPMDTTIKKILNGIVILVAILFVLSAFGILESTSGIRIGRWRDRQRRVPRVQPSPATCRISNPKQAQFPMSARDEYVAAAKQRLDDWDTEMDTLEAKALHAREDDKACYQELPTTLAAVHVAPWLPQCALPDRRAPGFSLALSHRSQRACHARTPASREGWQPCALPEERGRPGMDCRCIIPKGYAKHHEVRIMKPFKIVSVGAVAVVGALLAALPGCQREEGPAERAGKNVDNAVEHVGDQMEKAGDSIKDATTRDNN